jgi:hypothetical protein
MAEVRLIELFYKPNESVATHCNNQPERVEVELSLIS